MVGLPKTKVEPRHSITLHFKSEVWIEMKKRRKDYLLNFIKNTEDLDVMKWNDLSINRFIESLVESALGMKIV